MGKYLPLLTENYLSYIIEKMGMCYLSNQIVGKTKLTNQAQVHQPQLVIIISDNLQNLQILKIMIKRIRQKLLMKYKVMLTLNLLKILKKSLM